MKKLVTGLLFAAVVCILLTPASAFAQDEGRVGLGLMIGEPTGISFKYWTTESNAFDAGLAWSIGQYDAVHIHGDYLWHSFSVFDEVEEGALPVYYGIGARMVFAENDAVLGARVPVGLSYIFEEAPLDLFLEVAPTINLAPSTNFDMNGALGIRLHL